MKTEKRFSTRNQIKTDNKPFIITSRAIRTGGGIKKKKNDESSSINQKHPPRYNQIPNRYISLKKINKS